MVLMFLVDHFSSPLSVFWLQEFSYCFMILSIYLLFDVWQVCIAMKFYEGSVGDRIAQLKGGKLPLPDILRCYILSFGSL